MQRTSAELEALLDGILAAPGDHGVIEMIVRRPAENEREVLETAELTSEAGLVGDDWANRLDENGELRLVAQLTLMNSRVTDAVAVSRERWPLAGDQVYVNMDLSTANLPPGSKVRLGEAVIEISEVPHTGCAKFAGRFGKDALRFVNVGTGKANRFRGVNAFVIEGGSFSLGDVVTKL
jgi:MOSC domain-containing protein YiiM